MLTAFTRRLWFGDKIIGPQINKPPLSVPGPEFASRLERAFYFSPDPGGGVFPGGLRRHSRNTPSRPEKPAVASCAL